LDAVIDYQVLDFRYQPISDRWQSFLNLHFKSQQKIQIIFDSEIPTIIDSENRKLKIDFKNDSENYKKFKSNIGSEPLSRSLGSGKKGLRLLDLSAGMAIDAVFLSQLGYSVTAVERNPLLFLALNEAMQNADADLQKNIQFIFSEAQQFLKTTTDEFHKRKSQLCQNKKWLYLKI
jgi:16S rRNA (guanine1516-N2)-methyltransferase